MGYQWDVTGNLPDGLKLVTVNGGRKGYLQGKPTKVGTFNWSITVSDDSSPDPQTASQNYSMSISSALYLGGFLVDDGGKLPDREKNNALDNAFNFNRLYVQELGAHNSTFSVSIVEGSKPAWMTIAAGTTTNIQGDGIGPAFKYCTAPINFTGTPTDVGAFKFTIRVSSTTSAFQDYPITFAVVTDTIIVRLDEYYTLFAEKSGVAEGETIKVYLTTTNKTDGATVPYKITGGPGFAASDINVPLEGNFVVNSTVYREPRFAGEFSETIVGWTEYTYYVGELNITASADLTTEGVETMVVSLPSVPVAKEGWKTVLPIDIYDTSLSPEVKTLESSLSTVQEGGSFNITLTHSRASQGTIFFYTIEGVSSEDLFGEPLGGEFVIGYNNGELISPAGSGTAVKTFRIKPNGIVDSNKQFRITVPGLNLSTVVSITDANPTFNLSTTSNEIREGQTVTFTLFTSTVANGTNIPYSITGVSSADVGDRNGNPIAMQGNITVDNNIAAITIRAIEDASTEGDETMTFGLPTLGLSKQVKIIDSSQTPAPINYTLSLLKLDGTPLNASDELTEGSSFYVQIDASPQAVGSSVRYAITGIDNNLLDTTGSVTSLSGSFTMISRTFSIFNTEITSAFFYGLVKTKPDGGVNNLRTVTVTLTDLGLQASFKLKSPLPPPPPPPPPPSVDPVELVIAATPKGYVGVNYGIASQPIYVSYTGGTGPLTWSVSSGSLPTGMTAATENNNNIGHIYYLSGAPTTVGTYSFQITGTDTLSVSDTLSLSIVVEAPPPDGGGDNPGGGGTITDGGNNTLDQNIDDLFDR